MALCSCWRSTDIQFHPCSLFQLKKEKNDAELSWKLWVQDEQRRSDEPSPEGQPGVLRQGELGDEEGPQEARLPQEARGERQEGASRAPPPQVGRKDLGNSTHSVTIRGDGFYF